jgi:hypothetical protein
MDTRTLQVLVHNLAEKIKSRIPLSQIRWVPGTENPADFGTRPKSAKEVAESQTWLRGPAFLLKDPEEWPILQEPVFSTEEKEEIVLEIK